MNTQRHRIALLVGSALLAGSVLLPGSPAAAQSCEQIGAIGAFPQVVPFAKTDTIWVANFTDSDAPGGDETYTISWGDGEKSAGTFVHVGLYNAAVEGTHAYTAFGKFTVMTIITDSDASPATAIATTTVTVR